MRLLLLLMVLPVFLPAQRAKEKHTRFVWADSGLVMRATGEADAEKIMTVPFGAEVRLTGKVGQGTFVTLYDEPKDAEGEGMGWQQFGHYLEVEFENATGFVHSTYLSRWSPAKFKPTGKGYYRWEAGPIDTLVFQPADARSAFQEESYQYPYGITVSRDFSEKYSGGTIVIPNMTLQEGFHFARKYFALDVYSSIEPEYTHFFLIGQSNNQLNFRQDLLEVTIIEQMGVIIISYIASC